jgi:hypothetical protein
MTAPHVERMILEYGELCTRIERLEAFMVSPKLQEVSSGERTRLAIQHVHMAGYRDVLLERLKAAGAA